MRVKLLIFPYRQNIWFKKKKSLTISNIVQAAVQNCKLIMAAAKTLEDKTIWEGDESLGEEVLRMSTEEVISRTRLLDNEVKIMKSEVMRISHELQAQKEKIKENTEKIKVNKTLPYLVSNVIELLDVDPQDLGEEDGANVDLDSQRKGKCAVIKTSTRQTYFLPVIGLVDAEKLKPGDDENRD